MSENGDRPELPEGWEWKTLGDIGKYYNGRGFKKSEWRQSGRPIIRIQNLTDPRKPFNYFDGRPEEEYTAREGDILMSWAATLDVFRWSGPEAVVNQHIFKVESAIDPSLHFWLLKAVLDDLYAKAHGTGMVHIKRDRFLATPVPVPPSSSQPKLVKAIEGRFAAIKSAEAELREAHEKTRIFRASCLEAAFSPDSDLPTAPLGELAVIQSGITKGRPIGAEQIDTPYIRTANVQAGYLDLAEMKTLPASPIQRERHRLRSGDVLILEGGDADKVGRGWIWEGEVRDCLHQNHVFAVRPDSDRLHPRYLAYFVNAPIARRYFLSVAKQTTNLASINKTNLKGLAVPIPDFATQEQVAERLDRRLRTASELGKAINAEVDRSNALRHGVLRKAVAGQLTHAGMPSET